MCALVRVLTYFEINRAVQAWERPSISLEVAFNVAKLTVASPTMIRTLYYATFVNLVLLTVQ